MLSHTLEHRGVNVPVANAVFFNGDRVEGSGNPVIERLSDIQKIAEILVSKFGSSINAWVFEAPSFNGPFAVYKELIPSVNKWGEPKSYSSVGFPASTSIISLLSTCLKEWQAKNVILKKQKQSFPVTISGSKSTCSPPRTFILGFSKGGTVLNQLVTELAFSDFKSHANLMQDKEKQTREDFLEIWEENQIIPNSKEAFLHSIAEIHYVDVGLNCAGAYLTDHDLIEKISMRLVEQDGTIRFVLHGTPRQWCDSKRVLIRTEKDKLLQSLEFEAQRTEGKLQVCERFYFADQPLNLQMHFEIIEVLDVS